MFVGDCRSLPQFGKTQEVRLIAVLMDLQTRLSLSAQGINEETRAEDVAPIPVAGEFHPDFVSAWQAVYQRAWQRAHFEKFIYLPSSLPEFVKHPDVLRGEIGPEIDLSQYFVENASLRRSLPALTSAVGLILMDRARLDMIFHRRGPYAGLSETVLVEQRQMVSDLIAGLPGRIEMLVCDIEVARLSPGAVVGDMVVLGAMGGYVVTQNDRLAAVINARCRDASKNCETLVDYLAALDDA